MSRTYRTVDYNYGTSHDKHWDGKKWYKPNANFKHYAKRARKAKEKRAMYRIDENEDYVIPDFPKTDVWDWN